MRKDFLIHFAVALPFILLFNIYLSTVCPTVYAGDSGELTVAAFSLGIPHPSGYPLFTIIGKLFTLLPFGSIAFRVNVMSIFFSVLTVWIIYLIILRVTKSVVSSLLGSLSLAFSQAFWLQTVSAEVYPIHFFFVAIIILVLLWIEEKPSHFLFYLLVFIIGLSFTNHLQTLMLIPAVFFILVSRNIRLLNFKSLLLVFLLLLIASSMYLYLPIRTYMEAAIHWGDPDTWENFYTVVSGKSHRSGYVFNKGIFVYLLRLNDTLWMVLSQLGMLTVFSLVGFWKTNLRWKFFYILVIVFDTFYTVFLNTVSLEITPFNIASIMVLAVLAGKGAHYIIQKINNFKIGSGLSNLKLVKSAILVIPMIFLISNYSVCNQSLNYTAYENSQNILRTVNPGGTLVLSGDNYLFPVSYSRFVEKAREDVNIFDWYFLFFKMPCWGESPDSDHNNETLFSKQSMENLLIKMKSENGFFISNINPDPGALPEEYQIVPWGVLGKILKKGEETEGDLSPHIWNSYITQSLEDSFYRDYMTSEITADYNLNKGKQLILLGGMELGIKRLNRATAIAPSNDAIHTAKVLFLVNTGFYEEAKKGAGSGFEYFHR